MLPQRIDQPVLTVSEIRAIEKALFQQHDSYKIMQQAGRVLADLVLQKTSTSAHQTIHCILGTGLLKDKGLYVVAYQATLAEYTGDATQAYQYSREKGVTIVPFHNFSCTDNDIIVDALLGIGLHRAPDGKLLAAIQYINACKRTHPELCVYSVDVPSGVCTDTGHVPSEGVIADMTVTFIADKRGLHTSNGKACSGEIIVDTLGADDYVIRQNNFSRYTYETIRLNPHSNDHKGDFGHALIVGSGTGMFGAGAMSAISALKSGAGKSSLYSHPDSAHQYHLSNTPLYEIMRAQQLNNISGFSAICLGPGLGRDDWATSLFAQCLEQRQLTNKSCPLLIDADGLYHLAQMQSVFFDIDVITPHEGEAAQLLNTSVDVIRQDKPNAVQVLAEKYQCIAVLKGAGTLVSNGKDIWISATGNINLATAGSGDILAGIISSYLAQGLMPIDAALFGVYRHGLAADKYLLNHEHKSMRATDIWDYL